MITTAEFLQLSPKAQREMLIDGMFSIRLRLSEAAQITNKFNGWNATLDPSEADRDYLDRYREYVTRLRESADDLTEQILLLSQKTKQILESAAAGEVKLAGRVSPIDYIKRHE